jgi:hypothetical protein
MGAVRPVLTGLEYLARPWGAAVEAYGAAEADVDPWRAAKRVLSKGIERRQFPTIGERLIPEEEDEGLGTIFARLGVDIVTDPTTWLGPGAVKGVGGALVKGARIAGKTKVAQTVARSAAGQGVARAIIPTMENLSFYGKKAGTIFGQKHLRASRAMDNLDNKETGALLRKVEELGLKGGGKNEARRIAAAQTVRTGKRSGDAQADELAGYLSHRLDVMGRFVRRFRDTEGKGVEIMRKLTKKDIAKIERHMKGINAEREAIKGYPKMKFREAFGEVMGPGARFMGKKKGYTTPFQLEQKYYPQVMKEEVLMKAMTKKGFNEQTENLMKQLSISRGQAENILQNQTGRARKAGHIEHARTAFIPDELLELDPLKVMPRYSKQTLHRLSMASEFGLESKGARRLLDAAEGAGLNTATATEAMNQVRGVFTESKWGIDNIAPNILGWNVLSKMGLTSGLAQLTQTANPIVSEGVGNFVKGLLRMRSVPGMNVRATESFNGALRNQMRHMAGTGDPRGRVGRAASKYLRIVQFNRADEFARSTSYAAGVSSAESAAKEALEKGLTMTPKLKAMGIGKGDVAYYARSGKFTPGAERRIGNLVAEKTQFLSRFTDLPPAWQTPEFRIATQFKSFIYQQSRFLTREVMRPAIKYVDTGGKEGSIAPLLRAMATFPAAGQTVAATRELMAEMGATAIGAKRKRKRKFDYDHPIAQMVNDSMYVGAFGIGADIIQQASRGNFLEFIMGPTVSDISQGVEFLGKKAMAQEAPTMEELARMLYPHLPGRRILPLQPQEVVEAAGRGLSKVKRAIR